MSSILRVEMALHRFTTAAQGAAGDREDLTLVVAPAPRRQLSARALDFDSLPQFARAVGRAYLQQQDEASLMTFSTASRVSPVRF